MKKKFTLLSVAILCALIAVGVYLFLFFQVKARNEHISELTNSIELQAVEEDRLRSVRALVGETEKLRAGFDAYLIGKDEAVSFLEDLEKLGKEIGVETSIAAVAVLPPASGDPVEELRLVLTAEGSWRKVVTFLGLLELLPQGYLEQAAITEGGAQGWAGNITLRVFKEL